MKKIYKSQSFQSAQWLSVKGSSERDVGRVVYQERESQTWIRRKEGGK